MKLAVTGQGFEVWNNYAVFAFLAISFTAREVLFGGRECQEGVQYSRTTLDRESHGLIHCSTLAVLFTQCSRKCSEKTVAISPFLISLFSR